MPTAARLPCSSCASDLQLTIEREDTTMKRITIPVLLLAGTLGLGVVSGQALLPMSSAVAQGAKARQQWEYASLIVEDLALDMHWQAGKTTLSSGGDVLKPDDKRSVNEL